MAIAAAGTLALLALMSWSWRSRVAHSSALDVPPQVWDHVRGQFPMPPAQEAAESDSSEALAGLVEANPFSSQRRQVLEGQANDREAPGPAGPAFLYKGRIQLGARQRAIVEDRATGKTYFLEVGQEVAGHKVLDITEDRVILSAPDTQEHLELLLLPQSSP